MERNLDGFFVSVCQLSLGVMQHARSLNQLTERIKEPIELCLDVQEGGFEQLDLVGVQRVTV